MLSLSFSNEQIQGLASGNEKVFDDALRFIRVLAHFESRRKHLSHEENDDTVISALIDAVTAVQSNEHLDGPTLERIIKRSVWRNAQRQYRKNRHDYEKVLSLDDEEISIQLPVTESVQGRLEAEQLLDLLNTYPKSATLVYKNEKTQEEESRSKIDLLAVDDELIRHFQKHPEKMYELNPRRFEELVAAILKDLGYSVELTPQGADGGVDIFATQKSGVGDLLLIVDCKRYAPKNHVGVDMVRALYGISEQLRATRAMVATTSFFTRATLTFQRAISHRLALKDYNDLNDWLGHYGINRSRKTGS